MKKVFTELDLLFKKHSTVLNCIEEVEILREMLKKPADIERYVNLLREKVIKLAFFVDEEIGCVGSSNANMKFFDDVSFVLQADRQGYEDVAVDIYGIEMFGGEFFDKIDLGILNFTKGANNYINNNKVEFDQNLRTINILEKEADTVKRKIENLFYLHSLMPHYSSDILNLLESVDDIMDMSKDVLNQFDVETPNIPELIKNDFLELISVSYKSAENVIPAARIFFTSPDEVKDKIQKVLFYNREADVLSNNIKRKMCIKRCFLSTFRWTYT